MKKNVLIILLIAAAITTLTGVSYLVEGIAERGWGGVNYGRVIFPLLIGVFALFNLFRAKEPNK